MVILQFIPQIREQMYIYILTHVCAMIIEWKHLGIEIVTIHHQHVNKLVSSQSLPLRALHEYAELTHKRIQMNVTSILNSFSFWGWSLQKSVKILLNSSKKVQNRVTHTIRTLYGVVPFGLYGAVYCLSCIPIMIWILSNVKN